MRQISTMTIALRLAVSGTALVTAQPSTAQQINPLATTDQTETDQQALRVLALPAIQKAKENVAFRWRAVLHDDPPEEAWSSFDSMMDDYTYNYVLKAVADANYPKVIHVYTQPHVWRGMHVPGSRWGGNNPDNIYRIIPIDGKAHFRIDGRRFGSGPSNVSFVQVGDYETTMTLNQITAKEMSFNSDGTFTITVDPDPANGRPNHIQTMPEARFLFVRDSLGDWSQRANALSVYRLDPPDAPQRTDAQVAQRAARAMIAGQAQVYYYVKFAHGKPNVMPDVNRSSGSLGGLLTQRASVAQAILKDDEALVVTLDPAAADYYSLVAHNYWYITIDYAANISTLNNGQVTRNADGTVTYVVSLKDPGVHNWIDTAGIKNSILQLRLQGLTPDAKPWVKSRLVKLSDLKAALPADTKWITAQERQSQLAERRAQYKVRMADH